MYVWCTGEKERLKQNWVKKKKQTPFCHSADPGDSTLLCMPCSQEKRNDCNIVMVKVSRRSPNCYIRIDLNVTLLSSFRHYN